MSDCEDGTSSLGIIARLVETVAAMREHFVHRHRAASGHSIAVIHLNHADKVHRGRRARICLNVK